MTDQERSHLMLIAGCIHDIAEKSKDALVAKNNYEVMGMIYKMLGVPLPKKFLIK